MLYLGSQFFIELLLFVEQIINLATRLLTLPHLGSQCARVAEHHE